MKAKSKILKSQFVIAGVILLISTSFGQSLQEVKNAGVELINKISPNASFGSSAPRVQDLGYGYSVRIENTKVNLDKESLVLLSFTDRSALNTSRSAGRSLADTLPAQELLSIATGINNRLGLQEFMLMKVSDIRQENPDFQAKFDFGLMPYGESSLGVGNHISIVLDCLSGKAIYVTLTTGWIYMKPKINISPAQARQIAADAFEVDLSAVHPTPFKHYSYGTDSLPSKRLFASKSLRLGYSCKVTLPNGRFGISYVDCETGELLTRSTYLTGGGDKYISESSSDAAATVSEISKGSANSTEPMKQSTSESAVPSFSSITKIMVGTGILILVVVIAVLFRRLRTA